MVHSVSWLYEAFRRPHNDTPTKGQCTVFISPVICEAIKQVLVGEILIEFLSPWHYSAAIWQILVNYCYLSDNVLPGENWGKIGERVIELPPKSPHLVLEPCATPPRKFIELRSELFE